MFTRFNGNVVPFADDSTSTNRTVFGGTTQSDLIDDNLNTNFKKGWEIVGLNDNPTREDFNAMGYTLGALTAYLYEMGISEWNASQNYRANSRVTGSDGKIYKSLTGTTGSPNVGKNPTSDAVNWKYELLGLIDSSSIPTATTELESTDFVVVMDSTEPKKITLTNFTQELTASSETTKGIIELATTAEAQAGTDDLRAITPLKLRNALNASGTAPIYACRAWVNFNGTGTVAIRASGNVSSITDNGVGSYAVNFTTAMPDTNYCAVLSCNISSNGEAVDNTSPRTLDTTSVSLFTTVVTEGASDNTDSQYVFISIFR